MLKSNHDSLNVFTFKWGTKYGPEYVNRLYNSMKKYCNMEFTFYCITDNSNGIYSDIKIIDYNSFNHNEIFTLEKVELMNRINHPNNLLLDLDILIHNDITDLCTREIFSPTFIWTHWTPDWHKKELISKKTACFVNSSFVRWSGENAKFLWQYFLDNKKYLESEYKSCDKYLFYEHYMREKNISFWEDGAIRFYNYNEEGPTQYQFNPTASCCLFNTSHLIRMGKRCFELSETPDWAIDIWESYDE